MVIGAPHSAQSGGFVGVRRGPHVDKRDLLLFDRVVVIDLERQYGAESVPDSMRADMSYLIDAGKVESVAPVQLDRQTADAMLLEFNAALVAEMQRRGLDPRQASARPHSWSFATRDRLRSLLKITGSPDPQSSAQSLVDPYFRFLQSILLDRLETTMTSDLGVVMVANYLETVGLRAVGVVDDLPGDQGLLAAAEQLGLASTLICVDQRPALQLAVSSLPVPADDVPLYDVMEFLSDAETKRHRDRLVRRLLQADFDGQDPAAVTLEIEESVESYRDYMRIADIRQQSMGLTVLLAVVGAIDDMLHFHIAAAANRLVSIKEVKADRLLTQMNAPGRETAVIYEAAQRYGGRG